MERIVSKTPNFRNPSTNPFSLELISSLQISRESLSVRGLPLARLILVGQMRKGRVVVKAGGGGRWNGKWGRSVFDIPLYRSPNLPPTTLSLTSLTLDRGSTTHIPPPPPHLYLSFRVNRGRTRYVHLTVFDSRVILPLESSSALRPKKKDRPFYPSYLVEDRTCPLRETVPRKRGNFKPSGSNVERCCFLFSFFFSLDENVFHPLEKFATFCIWILYTFILLSLSFALAI